MSPEESKPESDPEDEVMRYGILGEDPSTTADKLEKYTGEVAWSYLKPHFETGALLYVDPSLDLTVVGEALANDAAETVRSWRQSGDLVTPSQPHADFWEESDSRFRALVVSPFVLIQPVDSSD